MPRRGRSSLSKSTCSRIEKGREAYGWQIRREGCEERHMSKGRTGRKGGEKGTEIHGKREGRPEREGHGRREGRPEREGQGGMEEREANR